MGLYSTISSSNSSEMMAEKIRAQAAERAAFGNSVLAQVQGPFSSYGLQSDVYTCKDGFDDGRISFSEKVSNFCNGVVAPIKNIFASPKNMAVTALTVAAGAGLIALTGGAAAPVMVALGLIGGGTQIVSGLYKQATATTDAQAAQAWNQMGTGTFTMGVSALGAKSSLKAAGVKSTSNMTTWQAVVNCVKNAPAFFSQAVKTASPKVAAFVASLKTAKFVKPHTAPKTPKTSNPAKNPSNNPRLETSKGRLELKKGEPVVTVETPKTPKNQTANPPRVIELPDKMAEMIVEPQQQAQVSNPPRVIELPDLAAERLALPPAKPQYRINYTTEDYFPKNVLMPGQTKPQVKPQTKILGLPAPQERLGLPGPSTGTKTSSTPKFGSAIKTFMNGFLGKIKESLKLFGLFID